MRIRLHIVGLMTVLAFRASAETSSSSSDALFVEHVWPLLDVQCVKCHGPEKQKAGLRLDSREATLRGGDSGPAMVPGNPADSLLLQLVRHAEKERTMPPKEKLADRDITRLEEWITKGAPWPAIERPVKREVQPGERIGDAWNDPRNPIVEIFHGQRLDLWSMKPITKPEPPGVDGLEEASAIDRFLAANGHAPAESADRRTLARRLYFDLIGLPPTPAQVEAFVNDPRPDAYERLVDELLASPHYGEHWARWWLDAVRYGDSNGFDWDEYRPQAWRFRDYVIRSLNADKPYDRFVREQLAGDELVPGAPHNAEDQDALIATGYLRLGPWDNSAAQFGENNRVRQQWMNDLTETTGAAFLGLSLSCCRCHDHKTDPISQADYYRFASFFEPAQHRDDLPLDLAPEQEAIKEHNVVIDQQLEEARKERTAALAPARERVAAKREPKDGKPPEVSDDDARKELTDAEKPQFQQADSKVQKLKKKRRAFLNGLVASDGSEAPKPTRILFQGNLAEPRAEVMPGFLSLLDPNPATVTPPKESKSTGRRTALADWILSPDNPLTARVIVNRIWQGHFGEGLVTTTNDFGFAGTRPTQPTLLDWLACEFVRQDWSMKSLHRTIVTSATYQSKDQPMRRLSAEQLRDAMLVVSGRLTDKHDGPPVWPPLPPETLNANPALLDDNAEKTKGWYPSPADQLGARSVFLIQKRTVRVPFMETFDLPDNAVPCARRIESTVAPQALMLLNDPFAIECANAFSQRTQSESPGELRGQIQHAFELAVQRAPDEAELAACLRLGETRGLVDVCRVLMNLNEFIYVE